jgi:hypothetical protein
VRFAWSGSRCEQSENPEAEVVEEGSTAALNSQAFSPLIEMILSGAPPASLRIQQVPPEEALAAFASRDEAFVSELGKSLSSAGRYDVLGLMFAAVNAPKTMAKLIREWPQDLENRRLLTSALEWALGCLEPANSKTLLRHVSERMDSADEDLLAVCMFALTTHDQSLTDSLLRVVNMAPGPAVVNALSRQHPEAVLRATKNAPLLTRSRLLWAAWRVEPGLIRQRDLWPAQASIDELLALNGRGSDGRMLEDDWVQEIVVRPAVESAVRDVERRDAFAKILAWPVALLGLVPVESLAAAFSRATQSDPVLAELLAHVSRSAEREELEISLIALQDLADSAVMQAEQARAETDSAREAEARAFKRSAEAEREQISAAHRELRQERIDTLRGFVAGMSAVARLDLDATAEDAFASLSRVAESLALKVIGERGERVSFDPVRHELLGASGGAEVVIMEPGFEYHDHEGSSVLSRAAVVRAND